MATHGILWPNVLANLRGERPKPLWPLGEGRHGSVNYWMMNSFTVWRNDPSAKAEKALLDTYAEFRRVGHLSMEAKGGVATEQGIPGAHWYFNLAPALGTFRFATIEKRVDLEDAALAFLLDEVGLNRAFTYNGWVVMPSPRIKDEKHMTPHDGYRDVFTALALGKKAKKSEAYWKDDQSAAVRTMKLIVEEGLWPVSTAQRAKVPKLYLPIMKSDLPGGGYLAQIEDTPEARKAIARDACNWVRMGPRILFKEGEAYGYDWSEPPVSEE